MLGERKALVEQQLAEANREVVTGEQLKELKEVFAHFDKNANGLLDESEFKGARYPAESP